MKKRNFNLDHGIWFNLMYIFYYYSFFSSLNSFIGTISFSFILGKLQQQVQQPRYKLFIFSLQFNLAFNSVWNMVFREPFSEIKEGTLRNPISSNILFPRLYLRGHTMANPKNHPFSNNREPKLSWKTTPKYKIHRWKKDRNRKKIPKNGKIIIS
jgi:hypothetical protein